jgi:hypothetical protein
MGDRTQQQIVGQMAKAMEEHNKKCKGKYLEEAQKEEFKREKHCYYF